MSVIRTVKEGIDYMKMWPMEPLLNPVFAENRVKKAMSFAKVILPPFFVLVLIWDVYLGGWFKGVPLYYALQANITMTVFSLVFILLIPFHIYYWFGCRARTPLNEKQKKFYKDICNRLGKEASLNPLMSDLEKAICLGIKSFGSEFLKEL